MCEGKERYTPKSHHDLVVSVLPDNSDIVQQCNYIDRMVVFGEYNNVLFDSEVSQGVPNSFISQELQR